MKAAHFFQEPEWDTLIQSVAKLTDDLTLKRGYQYYKQGRVQPMESPEPRIIKSYVQGNKRYSLSIDLDHFNESQCNCPVSGVCKHLIAALLEFAEQQELSIYSLVNAKTNAQAKALSFMKKTVPPDPRTRKAQLQEQVVLLANHSLPQWYSYFELCIQPITEDTRGPQFVSEAQMLISHLPTKLSPESESFFKLHSMLFILAKLTKQSPNQSSYLTSYLSYQIHPLALNLQDKIIQGIAQAALLAIKPEYEHLVQQTLVTIRQEMLLEPADKHYFLTPYLTLWGEWRIAFPPPSEEIGILENTAHKLGAILSGASYQVAQIGMHFYQSQDQEAWKLLKVLNSSSSSYSEYGLFFLSSLVQSKQWQRLVTWLAAMAPLFRSYRNPHLSGYSSFWDTAIEQQPDAEEQMWDTYVYLLPYSRAIYENQLIVRGQYKRWMDYHLSTASDPLDFRVIELAPLEKNAPEVLLPFYHQAVERCVLQKNRDSYKAAVKMLKRLAKLYRKLKQEPRWEQFLTTFVNRNSRLRALQEELRKGKLTT